MIKIDLLKGEGIPVANRPGTVALMLTPFVIPVVISALMAGAYLDGRATLKTHNAKLASGNAAYQELADIQQFLENVQAKHTHVEDSLSEVDDAVDTHMQWSSIILALVDNLPDNVALSKLRVKRNSMQELVPHQDDSQRSTLITYCQYTLTLVADSFAGATGSEAIQNYIHSLQNSSELQSKIENVDVTSQKSARSDDSRLVHYEINCVFKVQK